MNVFRLYTSTNIVLRILIGIVLATILYLVYPAGANKVSILGDIFITLLRSIAPFLVFILVMSSIANANFGANNAIRTLIIIYLISVLSSAIIAVIVSTIFPVSITLNEASEVVKSPSSTLEVLKTQVLKMIENPISALVNSNFLGLLTWSVLFGIALRTCSENTLKVVSDFGDTVTKVVKWIVELAPIGVFGILSDTLANQSLSVFVEYGKLIGVLLIGFAIVTFVQLPIIGFALVKRNTFSLLVKILLSSGITAFFGRSSAANIPVNMANAEKMKLDRSIYSFSIPFGANINLTGSSVTLIILPLAAVYSLGIEVNFVNAVLLCIIATLCATGASGVPGGSLIMIPILLSLFNVPIAVASQMVAIGFLISVIQDSVETMINSSSDLYFTSLVCEKYNLIDQTENKS